MNKKQNTLVRLGPLVASLLFALAPCCAEARGGRGGDPTLFFGVIALFVAGGACIWAEKRFRGLFRFLGGLVVLVGLATFVAGALEAFSIVPSEYLYVSFVISFFGTFVIVGYVTKRKRRSQE